MEIHIGAMIKSRAKAKRIGPTELGAKIDTSKQNVYGIFKRKSIDTDLLQRISEALNHDFFQELSVAFQNATGIEGDFPIAQTLIGNPNNSEAEKEKLYLLRINTLLEEKVAHLEQQLMQRA